MFFRHGLRSPLFAFGFFLFAAGALPWPGRVLISAASAQADADEDAAFQGLRADPTIPKIRQFLRDYPFGTHKEEAQRLLVQQQENLTWSRCEESRSRDDCDTYLALYPSGEHVAEARRLSEAPPAVQFTTYPGARFDGTVLDRLDVGDDECRQACADRSACNGYDAQASTNQCHLYSSIAQGVSDPAFSAGSRQPVSIAPPPPSYTAYPGVRLNGNALSRSFAGPERCKAMCDAGTGTCEGYDVDVATDACRLFSSINDGTTDGGFTAATRRPIEVNQPPPPVQAPQMSFNRYRNFDSTQYPDRRLTSSSVNECESFCRDDRSCRVFTFDAWNRKCYLKSRSGLLKLNARATTGMDETLPSPQVSSTQVTWELFNGKSFPGQGYSSVYADSRDDCQATCASQNRCIAFSFRRRQTSCALFDAPGEYQPSSGTASGAKIQP